MGMADLNSMTLKELKDLQAQVAKAIASFEDRKKLETLAKLRELARADGFQLEELTALTTTRKRAPSAVTYANPANKSDTWSGRGRKPRWFIEAMAAGKKREDLLV
ncbi:H-NS histone family protein [Rhodobacteraceae bacterium CYK-10]|uniref:H-NS histone family protein n=2 Tax=Stagnihabitans tardus TaxID=2699202 RepID=A0AAE4YAQ8_9RHOB|nr:H-NS histone family protein [Stagnihabitans tardus]